MIQEEDRGTAAEGVEIGDYYFSGPPVEVVDALEIEAEERDDPLLRAWCLGARAERRQHEYWMKHKTFDGLSGFDGGRAGRREATLTYAFSVTHLNALKRIATFVGSDGIVSIGAGSGWWERCLAREARVDVLAYDLYPPGCEENAWYARARAQYFVQQGDVRHLKLHAKRVMFLSWPPYDAPFARQALREFARAGGTKLVYVGETAGGCCGDYKFFDALERKWEMVEEIGVPQWPGIRDEVQCWVRKGR